MTSYSVDRRATISSWMKLNFLPAFLFLVLSLLGAGHLLAATPPAPSIAIGASSSSVQIGSGVTRNLSVLGADSGGESTLTYHWSSTGPATPTFSSNNNNAAKNTMATFN